MIAALFAIGLWFPDGVAASENRTTENACPRRQRGRTRPVARRSPVRWYDDADSMINPPIWWMPLPNAPAPDLIRKTKDGIVKQKRTAHQRR